MLPKNSAAFEKKIFKKFLLTPQIKEAWQPPKESMEEALVIITQPAVVSQHMGDKDREQ